MYWFYLTWLCKWFAYKVSWCDHNSTKIVLPSRLWTVVMFWSNAYGRFIIDYVQCYYCLRVAMLFYMPKCLSFSFCSISRFSFIFAFFLCVLFFFPFVWPSKIDFKHERAISCNSWIHWLFTLKFSSKKKKKNKK